MNGDVVHLNGMEPWLSKKELAQALRMSERWVERAMKDPDPIPFRRRGRALRFRLSEVEEWERRRHG